MTKQEIAKLLKAGHNEFAAGSSGGYDRYNLAHVRVVEMDGEALNDWGKPSRGIVIEFIGDSNKYRVRGKDGERQALESARWIQAPWPAYVEQKAKYEASQRATSAETDRRRNVAEDAQIALIKLGIREGVSTDGASTFRVHPDTMAAIVALIPVAAHV